MADQTPCTESHITLQLSSTEGPVSRRIKRKQLRDARSDEVPIIDICRIFSPSLSARQAVASQIHEASISSGFFYIKNHGIPSSIIEAAYRTSLNFFRQDDAIKEKVNVTHQSCSFQGWKPPNSQRINAMESIDIRESFSFRYDPKHDPEVCDDLDTISEEIKACLTSDNFLWEQTSNLPHFKQDIVTYWQAALALARKLVRSFALALSLPEDYFGGKVSIPDASVAINYYPSIKESPSNSSDAEKVSIGSHTDFQLFTILWQDSVGGLQILNKEDEWIKAPPIEGTLVINIADYLQRITNDQYVSTIHRAKNLSGVERISIPLFFGFNLNERCGVLPGCWNEDNPKRYEEISCKEYVELRARNMHDTKKEESLNVERN